MPIEARWFDNLREHSKQKPQVEKPEEVPMDDQQKELRARSTELLNIFIGIASPFLVEDVLDLGHWKISSATYITPPIPMSFDKTDNGSSPYYHVYVQTTRHVELSGVDGDKIGPENVTAGLFITIPEAEKPTSTVVALEGIEAGVGEITCTKTAISDLAQEEAARDRLTRIKDIQKTADAIKKYFDDNPEIAKAHNGHITVVGDARKTAVIQVPQK